MAFYSSGVEYGIHCLVNMLDKNAQPQDMTVREAAKLQGVPYDYLGKIFTKLAKAGLVESTEGRKGGYKLAKPAANISVLNVVQAIDGRKSAFECKEVRQRMDIFQEVPEWACQGMCGIHAVMKKAQQQMDNELANHSILELANQLHLKSHDTYDIEVKSWLETQRS